MAGLMEVAGEHPVPSWHRGVLAGERIDMVGGLARHMKSRERVSCQWPWNVMIPGPPKWDLEMRRKGGRE